MIRRDLRPDERHIVRTQWKSLMTPKNPAGFGIMVGKATVHKEIWARMQNAAIDDLMRRGQCEVACDEESPEVILGWVCWDTHGDEVRVHCVYVSPAVRKRGLGRFLLAPLLEHPNASVTMLTMAGERLVADIDKGHPAVVAEREAREARQRKSRRAS